MTPLKITLTLRSPLGTPLAGDTLFGQLCHAVREAMGTAELRHLLDGYPDGKPWLVTGDGFPAGFLPCPTVPLPPSPSGITSDQAAKPPSRMASSSIRGGGGEGNASEDRKVVKGKRWILLSAAALPLPQLLAAAKSDEEAYGKDKQPVTARAHHNTLNRMTGSTGTGEFAPYTASQIHFAAGQQLDVWCVLDETRCDRKRLAGWLAAIGLSGFGRDASIGLGKFEVVGVDEAPLPAPQNPQAYWTLGPCAPQGRGFDGGKSFWRVLTRFGRHGGALALSANPFKNPVLLAAAGAVLAPQGEFAPRLFAGQGITGVSTVEPATVHQGYAPVLPLQLEGAP